eukprot:UN24701
MIDNPFADDEGLASFVDDILLDEEQGEKPAVPVPVVEKRPDVIIPEKIPEDKAIKVDSEVEPVPRSTSPKKQPTPRRKKNSLKKPGLSEKIAGRIKEQNSGNKDTAVKPSLGKKITEQQSKEEEAKKPEPLAAKPGLNEEIMMRMSAKELSEKAKQKKEMMEAKKVEQKKIEPEDNKGEKSNVAAKENSSIVDAGSASGAGVGVVVMTATTDLKNEENIKQDKIKPDKVDINR